VLICQVWCHGFLLLFLCSPIALLVQLRPRPNLNATPRIMAMRKLNPYNTIVLCPSIGTGVYRFCSIQVLQVLQSPNLHSVSKSSFSLSFSLQSSICQILDLLSELEYTGSAVSKSSFNLSVCSLYDLTFGFPISVILLWSWLPIYST
jgi:hypothetical protein